MKKIVSVSRKTDVPAFYGDWFINRVNEGFAGNVNSFGGQRKLVSLKPEDVECFVFWSKNYVPFIDHLKILQEKGYKSIFHYTITGLPKMFECDLIDTELAINNFINISKMYSPNHINWRYDPIVMSDITNYDFHINNFANIAAKLAGYVSRCYFSFVSIYKKVKLNFDKFQKENNVPIIEPVINIKIKLANELAHIAQKYNITMYACCSDYLLNTSIKAGGCIDINIIKQIINPQADYKQRPSRKECRCVESIDIGAYDTCPNGCIYCYANINKQKAENAYSNHDVNSAFLGVGKNVSDRWITELNVDREGAA